MAGEKLKIMVSSTVYGSESDLNQIKVLLESYGYEVLMSKDGTIYYSFDEGTTPEIACIQAVDDCNIFFGIIFPRYGSGITHKEFQRAVERDVPMCFVTHHYIEFTRKLMQQYMYDADGERNEFEIQRTSVLDSVKVVDMYNLVRHKWVQPFWNIADILIFVETQFKDYDKRKQELENRGI